MSIVGDLAKIGLLAWLYAKWKAWRSRRLKVKQRKQRAYLYVHSAKLVVQLEEVTYHKETKRHRWSGSQHKKHFKHTHSLQWQLAETNKLLMDLMHKLNDEFSRVHINTERLRKVVVDAEPRQPPWIALPPPHEPAWYERFGRWLGSWWSN